MGITEKNGIEMKNGGLIAHELLIISHVHHRPGHSDGQNSIPGSRTSAGGYRSAGTLSRSGGTQPGTDSCEPSAPDVLTTMPSGTSVSRNASADVRVTA